MIPNETRRILGTSRIIFGFDPDELYYVDASFLLHLDVLMRRLGTEQKMGADEMRDWMNYLCSQLRRLQEMKGSRVG
jgi:hypothetical protein